MKFIIYDPHKKYLRNEKLNCISFLKNMEFVVFQPSPIKYLNVFCSCSVTEHYYLDKFINSYIVNNDLIFYDFFSLVSENKDDSDCFYLLSQNILQNTSFENLLSFSFFLAAFGYPITAGEIYKYLLEHRDDDVAQIARKFMYDFSHNNALLSQYYIENKAYLIKQGNKFYNQSEFEQASIFFEKIVTYHSDNAYINKLALSFAKSSQFIKAKNLYSDLNLDEASISELSINGYIALLQMQYDLALQYYSLAIDRHSVKQISKSKLILKLIRELANGSSKENFSKRITTLFSEANITINTIKEFVNLKIVRSEIYYSLGDFKNSLRDTLEISRWLRPDFFRAYENIYLIDKKNYKRSKKRLKRYIRWLEKVEVFFQKRDNLEIVTSIQKYLTSLLITLGRLEILEMDLPAAREYFFKAYNLNLEIRALEWLAYTYFCLTNYDLSLAMYQIVLCEKPNRVPIILQIIRLYTELGDLQKAHEYMIKYQDLLNNAKHKNASHLARRNLYYLLFDFKQAWSIFRDRNINTLLSLDKQINYYPDIFSLDQKIRQDSSIFVLAEWGPGDELRWASIYRELEHHFPNLTIGCDPRLLSLFQRSFPSITFLPIDKKIRGKVTQDNYHKIQEVSHSVLTQVFDNKSYLFAKNQDFTTLISDVLGECRTTIEEFPIHNGMLILSPDHHRDMQNWLKTLPEKKMNIGICWKSGLIDAARSIHYSEIDLWGDIFRIEDVNFINLQYANYEDDIQSVAVKLGIDIHNPPIDLRDDFESVAALMKHLDLVISPATAVAELAGMVGTETILFTNSIEVDWRVLPGNIDLWHSSIKHVKADRSLPKDRAQQSIIIKLVAEIKKRML